MIKNEFNKIIEDFNKLSLKDNKEKTFLEILKVPHFENIWSNILAFYLDPNETHGLHEFMILSIFNSLGINLPIVNLKSIRVKREFICPEDKRLDILVTAENFIIGIENKINAPLYNDLEIYSNAIESLGAEKKIFKIVLSKSSITELSEGFINLTYYQLVKSIKSKVVDYFYLANTKYYIFLLDFVTNTENLLNSRTMIENLEVLSYFQNNAIAIEKLISTGNQVQNELINNLKKINSLLDINDLNIKLKRKYSENAEISKTDVFNHNGFIFNIEITNGDNRLVTEIGMENFNLYSISYAVGPNENNLYEKLNNCNFELKFDNLIDCETNVKNTISYISALIDTIEF